MAVERYVESSPRNAMSRQGCANKRVNVMRQLRVNVQENQGVPASDLRTCILLSRAPAWRPDYAITARVCQREGVVTAAAINHDNLRSALA